MARRKPFVLPGGEDPCPQLIVDRGPQNKGVGRWVPEDKHTRLAKWLSGTRHAWADWPERVYIDPFCGPGRVQVKEEAFTRDGGCTVAWRQSQLCAAPFTKVFVGDIDEEKTRAAEQRLKALGAPVTAFVGPASETIKKMVAAVPKNALALAYLDPYNLPLLSFDIIRELSTLRKVDFMVHFSLMDLVRNVDMELDPERDRFESAAPNWREAMRGVSKSQLSLAFFEYWQGLIKQLGFTFSKHAPSVLNDDGRPIYRLALFSRYDLGNRVWDDIAKAQDPNYSLF